MAGPTLADRATPPERSVPDGGSQVARTRFVDRRLARPLLGAVGVLATLLIAEAAVRLGLLGGSHFPVPSEVIGRLVADLASAEFWGMVGATLQGWAIGLGLACIIAIPAGLAIGSNALLWRALRPTIEFLRPVPGVALVPLSILLFGLGLNGKVFLVTFGATWILLFQTIYGVREVDQVARDTVRTYRLNWGERVRFLVVPSALPFIATGLRIASAVALIVGVTAELVIGSPGLGRGIAFAEISGALVPMCSLILSAGLLGVFIHLGFTWLERLTLHWHVSHRAKAGE